MKVGILTFHFSDNFGALLQAYALRKWFLDRGHQVEFIDYCPAHVEAGGRIRLSLKPNVLRANAKNIYLKIVAGLHAQFGNRDQSARFADFRQAQLGLPATAPIAIKELNSVASQFDVIVAGSDQIWSASIQNGFDPAYFLTFAAGTRARRVSYAASFGRDSLSAEHMAALGPLLKSISSISVRELSGVDIVRTASGRSASCVPDPTLLHTNYDELLSAGIDNLSSHVFCYALRTGRGVREVAHAAAEMIGAPIISPHNVHRRWREIGKTVYPGPAEWLSQLAKASFVVTNSFHGTVFSIIFRKPFVVVGLPGSRAELNARSRNLLAQLGLMDRFVECNQVSCVGAVLDSQIDWSAVEEKQAALRYAGINFLERELAATAVSRMPEGLRC